MQEIILKRIDSTTDIDLKILAAMVDEAFALTMMDAPDEVKDFPLPTGNDLITGMENVMELWKVYQGDTLVGGALISVKDTVTGYLELFFIAGNAEGKGIGAKAWKAIENAYPNVKVWETATPYFQKRNIHFYVNKCGFHIVSYHNKWNPYIENGKPVDDEMFVFRKEIGKSQ